jgi:hypothetical protein
MPVTSESAADDRRPDSSRSNVRRIFKRRLIPLNAAPVDRIGAETKSG